VDGADQGHRYDPAVESEHDARHRSGTGQPGCHSPQRRIAALVLPPFLVLAAVIGLWFVFSYLVVDANQRFLLPPPHEVVMEGLLTWTSLSEILAGLWSTTLVTLVGLVITIALGMTLAVVLVQAHWIERAILPYAVVVQAVPIIAIVPLIVLWLGSTFTSRVVVTIIISIFPIITNTLFGLKSASLDLADLMTLHRAGRYTRLVKVQLPAALPSIFTGFRIAAGLAVIGAIVGDLFFRKGKPGIGRLLAIYQDSLKTEELITAMVFSSLLGLTLFILFGRVGSRFTGWHPSASRNRYEMKRRLVSLAGVSSQRRSEGSGPLPVRNFANPTPTESDAVNPGVIQSEPRSGLAPKVLNARERMAIVKVDHQTDNRWVIRRLLPVFVPPLGFALLLTAAWYLFSYLVLEPNRRFLVPPPHALWIEGFGDPVKFAQLASGFWTTSKVAIVGLGIAIALGVAFAIFMGLADWIERSFYPWAVVLQTIPVLALVPLVGLWFGFGFTGRLLVCVLISVFPIITNTLFGLLSADWGLHDLFTLHGAGRMSRLRKLEVRAAIPAMFTGFRIAAGLSVIGAIVGEFFFQRGERGLGNLLDLYRGRLETAEMFAALLLSSALGIGMFWMFTLLGNVVTRSWQETAGAA
jgi:NitT/TauT family transport system permease protein